MSALLQELDLQPVEGKVRLSGLVSVKDDTLPPAHIAEQVALHEVRLLYWMKERKAQPIDYIFFRRFADGRSPRVAAYVVENAGETLTREDLAELHRKVWLNGSAPLLYVEWKSQVDILRCAAGPGFGINGVRFVNIMPQTRLRTLRRFRVNATSRRWGVFPPSVSQPAPSGRIRKTRTGRGEKRLG